MSFTILDDTSWAFCRVCGVDRDTSAFADPGVCPYCNTALEDQASQAEIEAAQQELLRSPTPETPPDAENFTATEAYTPPEAQIDPDVSRELASRALCRRKFMPFIKKFRPKYDAGWVHEDICRRLERFLKAVENGESPRLVLMMPVRMGKSEIGSRHFAPWVLGHHPDWEIIAASGGQNLAMTFSRYIRDLVRDKVYSAIFPDMKLDPNSQSVENWNTTSGGGYMAAGIGTMIVGRGAHILLIDDPCTSPQAADSQAQRDAVWEWYIGAAINRLAPGGGVLGIMTHWNEDDWAGRVQQLSALDGESDKFEVVKYPAINDRGDEYILTDDSIIQIPPDDLVPEGARLTRPHNTALHPTRYTMKMLLNTKATYYALGDQRWWSALYQQNPAPEDGLYFTKDMFRYYSVLPPRERCHVYQAWDFAISEGTASDYTVGVTLYQDENDAIYVADVNRFKSGDSFFIIDQILDYARQWDATLLGFEDGQIWKAMQSLYDKRSQERRQYQSYEIMKPLTDKLVRASPLRGRMQQGKVYFDEKAPWFRNLYHELTRFPAGKHDDMCFCDDTPILMADGSQKPIRDVLPDEYVATPRGPRHVLAAAMTNANATVYEIEFNDGSILVGTGNHPISTERGWIPLDSITPSDIIHARLSQAMGESSWPGRVRKHQTQMRLSSMVRRTGATLTRLVRTSVDTMVELVVTASSIGMCGRSTMALSQRGTSFITATRTTSTTTLTTWSACPESNTQNTAMRSKPHTSVLRSSSPISPLSESKPRPGMRVLKAWLGIVRTAKRLGQIASRLLSFVESAARNLNPCARMPSSAPLTAGVRPGAERILSMKRRNVLEQKRAVYNLTVEDAHCYYANNVLVHNCDALSWCVRLTLSQTAPRPVDRHDKLVSWKDKLKAGGIAGTTFMAA